MKKIFFIELIVLLFAGYTASAQAHPGVSDADIVRAMRGGRFQLQTNKMLLEPNDGAALSLKLSVYQTVNDQTLELEGVPYDIDLPDGSDPNIPAPYKEGIWKIVQGGGTLTRVDATHYSYVSPAIAPAGKLMLISVELNPTSDHWPKLTLLQTLYFVDDQTAIVVNLPEAGFNNQKYVAQAGSGLKMPSTQGMDPRVAAHIDPALKAKMDQAQAAVTATQQAKGINVAAITSNAMAYYDAKNDLTAVKFTGFSLQMENGKDVRPATGTAAINKSILFDFSFKGKGVGTHALSDKNSGVGFLIIGGKGCGCGNNRNGEKDEAPCNGYVNITSADDKVVKGYIWAAMYSAVNKRIVKGFVHGKFTANIANMQ